MLPGPVVLSSYVLRKVTDLREWVILGSPGSNVAAVCVPSHAAAGTGISLSGKSALELQKLTFVY